MLAIRGFVIGSGVSFVGEAAIGSSDATIVQFTALNLAVGSPVFGTPIAKQIHVLSALGLTIGSPVFGTPAGEQINVADNAFIETLVATSPGWSGKTLRQRIEAGALSATVAVGLMKASLKFGLATSGQIDAAYIGHASPTGDPYDFNGAPTQLKFGGANTRAVSGAETVVSDAATGFVYDPSKPLIISASFSGSNVELAAFGS